jgi:uncharacterized protein (DUF2062 family)
MSKKLFRKFIPNPSALKDDASLARIRHLLEEPNLWHINRRSVSRGFLIGIFMAMIPLPMQMLGAALLAIACRGNLPIAVALTWITNPFTTPFVLFISYKLGEFVLGREDNIILDFSIEAIKHDIWLIGPPLATGIMINAIVFSIISYYVVQWVWRLHAVYKWNQRKKRNS